MGEWSQLIVALAVALVIGQPPQTKHPDDGIVTSVQFLDGLPLQRLRELGVGSVRIGLEWAAVEPQPDRFDLADPRIPGWIDQAHAAGLHVYASLGAPPSWAAPCGACMPNNLFDWYDYVYHVITQYKHLGNDITFGIWNEPNLNQFLTPPSPDLYGDLFHYANLARMDANPAARLAGPETEQGAEPSGFLTAALSRMQPDLRPQDVITVHWYPGTLSPPLADYMQRILGHVGSREVWLTETGEKNPDDGLQASRLQDIILTFDRRPSAQWAKIFVYRLYGDQLDPDYVFGLLRQDFSPRPAFDAYRAVMYRIFSVAMRAANGRYLQPDPGAGGMIRAQGDGTAASATFQIYDFNGGSLESGDLVRIQAIDGTFLRAGSNRPLVATDTCGCEDEGLFVVSAAGASPQGETRLTLRSNANGQYASLDGGRAADILVNRNSAGTRETFTVTVK